MSKPSPPHRSSVPRAGDRGHAGVQLRPLLAKGIETEHACEKSCACTTCHVIVRAGSESLDPATEKEDDLLDKAWGLELTSRLSCQARMKESDVTIEIPKYTLNQVSESRK